jgi:regulator of sigma E protease
MLTLLVFLLILSVLVLIHEAGHYLVAKKLGIKVEEFGWGMPPRAWGKKIGETIYSINWLPIGGFVKLYGEDEAGAGRVDLSKKEVSKSNFKRAYFARPVWQRAAVVVAGVLMNVLLAAIIYYVFLGLSNFKTEVPLLTDHTFVAVNQTNQVNSLIIREVIDDSPAEGAGLKGCTDTYCAEITTINGEKFGTVDQFKEVVEEHAGSEITLGGTNLASQEPISFDITPRDNPPENEGALGVVFDGTQKAVLSYDTPVQRIFSGFTHPYNLMTYQFSILGKLIGVSIEKKTVEPVGNAVSGPVGIFVVTGEVLKTPDVMDRVLNLLNLAGLLSISLAFFNILPIPALDGGRLFFILIEAVTGKKVNDRVETVIHTVGMAILLGLIVLVTFKDFSQLIFN